VGDELRQRGSGRHSRRPICALVRPVLASSAAYPIERMAPPLRWFAMFNPVTYGVAGLRDGLVFGFAASLPSLLLMGVVAIVTASVVGRALRQATRDV
jgi:ABC-type polysaccharide/polyol phosphate export permease